MKKLYVFDLDGVLIDSKKNMEISFNSLNTGEPFKNYFQHIGKPFKDILTEMNLLVDQDLLMENYNKASEENGDLITFYNGVEKHLKLLKVKGKKIAVVTSKDSVRAHAILDLLDITFDCIVCPDNNLRGKPAPDQLLIAVAHCNVDPCDAVYVGDMQLDMDCANRAGVDFIYAEYGYGDIEFYSNSASTFESV